MAISHVDRQSYDTEVLASDEPVLVDYWASWCGPCRMIAPELEKLDEQMEGLKIVKVNVDEQPDLAGQAGVMSIPTLALMRSGTEVGRIVGAMNAQQMQKRVEELLA
jgi:thioredoxin 1